MGQVAAIDTAYARVKTDFIFHCEDDWEFLRPQFIERSLVILNSRPDILMVSLRDKDDQNGHPVSDGVYFVEWVPYRLLDENYDAGEWGIWQGSPGIQGCGADAITSFSARSARSTRHAASRLGRLSGKPAPSIESTVLSSRFWQRIAAEALSAISAMSVTSLK